MRMQDRRVIITGASSGIGLETARLFLAEGARVALLDLDGGKAAAASLGKDAKGIACDVTDEASVKKAVKAAARALGGVDGLVNSAGVSFWRPLAETSYEDWRRVHSIDLDGPFLVTREALPLLRAAGGGTIVNLASGAGMRPLPHLGAYCSAKAGLVMLSRALALEFASENIRVNAVAPGPIYTPMLERTLSRVPDREAKMQEFLTRVGMRRLGTPEEVAKTILFLSCAESSFTTGAVIEVDGGRVQI
jgi:NAD(P)-dependent dehydrogenase (short-subunit alcohol dehydrogenase family)